MSIQSFTRNAMVVAALSMAMLSSAGAVPVRYDFTVKWNWGQLSGTTSSGWFMFDSALAIPSAGYFYSNVLSDFSFDMRGKHYGLDDISLGALMFDKNGDLWHALLGTHCHPHTCGPMPGDIHSFYLSYDATAPWHKIFAAAGDPGYATSHGPGRVDAIRIPEPGTIALLAAGLGVLGLRRSTLRQAVRNPGLRLWRRHAAQSVGV